jgi:hypothetical protein
MRLYRFSPIGSKGELIDAINHVAAECTWLYFNHVGVIPKIESLTIFAHYDTEYHRLKDIAIELGSPHNKNNGPRFKLNQPLTTYCGILETNGHPQKVFQTIEYLRIRQPDPYRMQVGCCDYVEDDYWHFKDFEAMGGGSPRTIERKDFEMLEFYSPDKDVLGYVVSS